MRRLPPQLLAHAPPLASDGGATPTDSVRIDDSPPSANRWLLPAATIYEAIIRRRNRHFDDARHSRRAAVPVVSVGNLTTGGTGKTPIVIVVCRMLAALGARPAILTRGYGARPGETADEVREFELALPDVPVVVNRDRVAGAAEAVRAHRASVCVLDDGFQHRRLARDLDIVVIDALDPFGREALLPAGRLREPVESLRRAGLIIVNRANQVSVGRIEQIRAKIAECGAAAPVLLGRVVSEKAALPAAGEPAIAVAGIGNPRTFVRLLGDAGVSLRDFLVFDDHHRYSAADAQEIASIARQAGAASVVTTRKDWVKLSQVWPSDGPRLLCVGVTVEIDDPRAELMKRLRAIGDCLPV
ncbi:MAG: tetraacyldisaccharide 4'-kinase [Phycisphaerae bacterium]|nr:tetraacyldisaccharide 4'-kinase [Phycisphaerae bacterium]